MESSPGVRQRVLIIDDDQRHVQLLKQRLEAAGYESMVAGDGIDGLNQAIHGRPDLIIADVLLPRMNGFKLVEQLKTNPQTSTIPVILMSAVYVTDEDLARGFELGAETYMARADLALRKPLQEEVLLEAAASLIRKQVAEPQKQPLRVLIVDDDPEAVRLLSKWLDSEGFGFDAAVDGEMALGKALESPFDVVLLDVMLPKVEGFDVLSRLKNERPATAVVMMTAYGSEQVAVEALRRGADDYLIKPLDQEEVVESVLEAQKKNIRCRELSQAAGPLREASSPELEEKERLIEELRQSSTTLMEQYNRLLAAEQENRAYAGQLEKMVEERTANLSRRSRELAALHSVLSAATRSMDLPEVMLVTLAELDQLLGSHAAAAFTQETETGRLRLVAQHDLPEEFLRQVSHEPGSEGFLAQVLESGQGRCVTQADGDPLLTQVSGAGCTVIIPMRSASEVMGLIVAACDSVCDIDEEGWQLLHSIGEETGVVVENVTLYDSLRQAYLSMIRSLAEAIDARDQYTRGHSEKVSAYAVATARAMALGEKDLRDIRDAGYLHDIGKIGTPDAVLGKEGVFSDDEMEVMRLHPGASHSIVTRAHLSPEIRGMIRNHHERYDGSGYPDGLKGEEIPIGSRILGVADAYDAMISDRSYRSGLTPEEAAAELRRCSGGQFDPRVVEAFLQSRDSAGAGEEGFRPAAGESSTEK